VRDVAEEIDVEAEGLLDGLEGEARAHRADLLERLIAHGVTLQELRTAHEEGLLVFLLAERIVAGGRTRTADELAAETGLPADVLLSMRRSQGLPTPAPGAPAFNDADAALARTAVEFTELGVTPEQQQAVARVLGRGLSRAAEVMRATVLELALEPGTSEVELAERYAERVASFMPYLGPMIESMLQLHLQNMVRTEAISATERAEGALRGARDVVVGFAYLVGFTRLGEEVPPEELGDVADRLVRLTGEIVEPPVRLVKTIGDAVMLVSPEPAPLLHTSLDLVIASGEQGERFPQLRVGVASGPALSRMGDWYGRPVNIASRVTNIARADSVLATSEVRDAAPDAVRWSSAGARTIKGVPGAVRLYRARPLPPEDAESGASA
jgi:adenylate cyclase